MAIQGFFGRQFLKICCRKTCITLNYRNEDWLQGFYQEMVWNFKGNRKGSFPGTNDELEQRREQVPYIVHFFGGAACLIDKSRSAAVTTVGDKYCNYALEKSQKIMLLLLLLLLLLLSLLWLLLLIPTSWIDKGP